jgi:zinc protease
MRPDLLQPSLFIDAETVHRVVLRNGLTVFLRRDPSAPVVAIVTHVRAGYFDETDDVAGISHVLEHMYFKGTARRGVGEIARETKASGGYLNASTIYNHTVYTTVLPASGLAAGIDIQADAYAGSLISSDELAKELEVIIQEAKRKMDSPSAVATETLFAVLHDRHRMRRWRIGHEEGLRALTRDDVVRFYRTFYRPRNTVLSIVGDLDPDGALGLVERAYGGLEDAEVTRSPGPSEPEWRGFRYRELSGDIAQAQVVFGWRTPGTLHADTPPLETASLVLGAGRASRLYRAVRERQQASSVIAYDYTPTELGVFVIHAESPAATAADAARGAWDQVRAIRDDGPTDAEIRRVQRLFETRWLRQLETMEGQAGYLAEWESLGDWRQGERFYASTMAVTPADVREVVRAWLDPERAGLVVYRPAEASPFAADPGDARRRLEVPRPEPLAPVPTREAFASTALGAGLALEREEHGVRVYRTPRGVPVLVKRKPGAPLVHVGAYTMGGAALEPESAAGLFTLLARGSLKGTEKRTAAEIAEDSENLGSSIGVGVAPDSAGWSCSVAARHLGVATELMADVVQSPVFPADGVETERKVAVAQLRSLRDDMYRYPIRLAMQEAFRDHPYGRLVLGTEATLATITREDLLSWPRGIASMCWRYRGWSLWWETSIPTTLRRSWPRTSIVSAMACHRPSRRRTGRRDDRPPSRRATRPRRRSRSPSKAPLAHQRGASGCS